MKIITKIIMVLIVLFCNSTVQSQITFDSNGNYGRIFDITFDSNVENRLYALSLNNHILQSNDKGETWEIIYSMPGNSGRFKKLKFVFAGILSFMVQSPTTLEDNGLYFLDTGSGDIIKYTAPIPIGAENISMVSYSVYAQDPFVAMLHFGYRVGRFDSEVVYYTNDGGQNWTEVYLPENYDSVFPNNVAISPTNPQKLFIARGNSPTGTFGGLFISNDAGQTWEEKMPGTTFKAIAFHPLDSDIILLGTDDVGYGGQSENLYRSVDGGDTWNIIPIPWEAGISDVINVIVFDAQNPNTVMVLEENEIVVTQDDWQSFEKYVHPIGPSDGYFYGLNASFSPFQQGEVFINSNFYPLLSTDYGATFSQLPNPFLSSTFTGIQSDSETHLYFEAQQGIIHKNLQTNEVESFDIVPLGVFSSNPPPFYHVEKNTIGRLYKYTPSSLGSVLGVSSDFGRNYDPLFVNFFDEIRSVNQDPNNSNIVWASFEVGGPVIIDFTDLNNVAVTPVALPGTESMLDVFIDENDSDLVYMAAGAKIYKSVDGGLSWVEKSNGLPTGDNVIYDIEQSPFHNNEYSIATNSGIFKTTDQGENWIQTYQGHNLRKMTYSQFNDLHAVASRMTRQPLFGDPIDAQIIYTTDGGETWIEVPFEAIAHVGSLSMSYLFQEDSVDVYLSTFDLGLIKYTIDLGTLETPDISQNSNSFIVYPNPAQDFINIKNNGDEIVSIHIYNAIGQIVMKHAAEKQIDIRNLESGIYFVAIKNAKGDNFIKRIVKK
ncbi:T9SS type A sorting domain-containing protein [Aequorivita sp. F47161]|uniref:T9SS type A sorting domain-containing protein n=1 Tax=Aequorivita vitellina TaxID=2874475 RepID=A0A9X1QS82_9FLAO|nr:T9SS type A sorting domain-containing protein [Aequorivita vitellina]MCG2417820.1 T9SS type A sorting domain-containing protein [Aequorivita vitellina]